MKLEGIRVVDISNFLPGPHFTMMMADHGAEVIRVENTQGGEPNREIGSKRDGVTVYYTNTHRGKKSLSLDLKTPEGKEIFLKLTETADVVVEAFRAGVVNRLGIGYEAVAARNPQIVYVSLSAFGQNGPYADRVAHDLSVQAMTGLASLNIGNDGKPTMPNIPAADVCSSLMAFSGVLMALLRRKETGRGDYIDISMMDSLQSWTANITGPVFAGEPDPPPRHTRTLGGYGMYNIYETSDGRFITLGGSEIKFASNLLTALGRKDLIPICEQPPGPAHDPVKKFLCETFLTKSWQEWIDWFEGRDICFAPVKTLREGFDDPHTHARQMLLKDDRGWKHIGIPIKFRNEPGRVDFHAPELGENSREILESLNYGRDEIEALKAKGVCRTP
jgi:crotonobetainyl-CoA:carnitine CoA-transferase CaiB-like acyl-CoA transferase